MTFIVVVGTVPYQLSTYVVQFFGVRLPICKLKVKGRKIIHILYLHRNIKLSRQTGMSLIVWAAPLKWYCYHLGLFYSELRGSPVIFDSNTRLVKTLEMPMTHVFHSILQSKKAFFLYLSSK